MQTPTKHESTHGKGDVVVDRLPLEIWYHIFELCLPSFSERGFGSYVLVPWDLSQVSREWRRVVQSCPSLWSNIDIHFAELDRREKAGHNSKHHEIAIAMACRLATQLKYSKACPLDIIANYGGSRIPPSSLWLQLVPHLPRARMLSVHDNKTHEFFRTARASLPASTDFPYLHFLYWSGHGGQDCPDFDLIGIAPRLHHMCLEGQLWEAAAHRFPWNQPKVVELYNMNVVNIIPRLQNVEELQIKSSSHSGNQTFQSLMLPKLHSLVVEYEVLLRVVDSHYSFPNLTTLELVTFTPHFIHRLSTFLRNTNAARHLTAFILYQINGLEAPELHSFLRLLPALTTLGLPFEEPKTASLIADVLSPTLHTQPGFPALRSIHLSRCERRRTELLPSLDVLRWMDLMHHRAIELKVEFGLSLVALRYGMRSWRVVDDQMRKGFDIEFHTGYKCRSTHRVLRSLNHECSFSAFLDVAASTDLTELRIVYKPAS